jgi:hypothetical protein
MISSLGRWPDGTGENTSQRDIERYVQRNHAGIRCGCRDTV